MADIKFKITVIGDAAVGKTSLIKKYTKGEFQKNYISSLGTQFTRHEEVIEGVSIELILWDIAGQQAFEVMRQNFYTGSSGAIIVFSHSPEETKNFNNIHKWLSEVREHCGNIQVALFGNKIDLINEEQLRSSELCDSNIEKYAKKHNFLGYYKTSALTGEGVYDAFYVIAKRLYSLGIL